jgi:hypothetical protein
VPEYDRTLGEKGLTTTAADSRSSHSSFGAGVSCGVGVIKRFRIPASLPLVLLLRLAAETA